MRGLRTGPRPVLAIRRFLAWRRAMWRIRTTLAIIIFGLLTGVQPGKAEITYPWCAQYAREGRNCGFSTYDQCLAAVSGNGGYCIENSMYRPRAEGAFSPYRPRR